MPSELRVLLTEPQLRFLRALEDPAIEQIGYGGARGGGKSYVLRVALVIRCLQYPGSRHLLLRRTHDDVIKQHEPEIRDLLNAWGIPFQYHATKKIFYIHQKGCATSELHLGFAEYARHAEKYQGQEFLTIAYDEATQFEEIVFDRIGGSARIGGAFGGHVKKVVTCNPGGLGHAWIKKRFVKSDSRDQKTTWIPARLADNTVLMARDPNYGDRLTRGLPEWMKKQWLEGDWDANEGAYFTLPPAAVRRVEPPSWARWWAGVDWGFHPSAFAVVWVATWQDSLGQHRAHVYQCLKQHKLNTSEQARAALDAEKRLPPGVSVRVRYADPATGKKIEGIEDEASRTTAKIWMKHGFVTLAARRHARVPGWMLLREMLAPCYPEADPEWGVLTIDPSCAALIEEITSATFETSQGIIAGDDIDARCDDHLLDALRYLLSMVYGLNFTVSLKSAYEKRPVPIKTPNHRITAAAIAA